MRNRLAILSIALLAAACGGGSADVPADTDIDAILDQAAEAMGSLQSARFTMERGGAPVEIAGLEFASAEGQYAAPASARAILHVRIEDLSVEVGTIAIGEEVWLTNPLTGGWELIPPESAFNLAIIFDPGVGWVPLLTEDLSGIDYRGKDSDGSADRHHLTGTIAASRIEFLTAGLVEAQAVDADLWIDPVSGHITRVEFTTVLDGATSTWLIRMMEFDEPVSIDPPAGS